MRTMTLVGTRLGVPRPGLVVPMAARAFDGRRPGRPSTGRDRTASKAAARHRGRSRRWWGDGGFDLGHGVGGGAHGQRGGPVGIGPEPDMARRPDRLIAGGFVQMRGICAAAASSRSALSDSSGGQPDQIRLGFGGGRGGVGHRVGLSLGQGGRRGTAAAVAGSSLSLSAVSNTFTASATEGRRA